jgi:hypothetical protein
MENNNEKNLWVSAWEAASIELVRRIRSEWLEDTHDQDQGGQEEALKGLNDQVAQADASQAQAIDRAADKRESAQCKPRQVARRSRDDRDDETKPQGRYAGRDGCTHGDSLEPTGFADASDSDADGGGDGEANESHGSDHTLIEGGHQDHEEHADEHGQKPRHVVVQCRDSGVGSEHKGPGGSGHGSGSCLGFDGLTFRLQTQNVPCNIRSHVLASHGPSRQPLNQRAVLSGDTPSVILPLTHCSLRHPKVTRERGQGAHDLGSSVNGVFHV